MVAAPTVHLYMLTEDTGAHVHATWTALLRRMCRLVDSSCDTQPATFLVEQPEEGARKTMAGNLWREGKPHRRLVEFWRTIVEQLESDKVVVFHVDGDVPWSRRETSANVRDVNEIARRRLRSVMEDMEDRPRTPEEIAARMALFVPIHPFREIEAWLFHNITVLRRQCTRRSIPVPDCAEAWAVAPELLDEAEQPKKLMPFKAEHNRDLAEDAFPADRVYELGSSFYEAVEALGRCEPLRAALARTHAEQRWQT